MWKNIAAFFVGAIVGGSTVYLITKTDFEKREQEAIDSIKKEYKDYYEKKEKNSVKEAEAALVMKLNEEKKAMAEKILRGGSNEEGEAEKEEKEDIPDEPDDPRPSNTPEANYVNYSSMFDESTMKKDIHSDREELGTTTPFYNAWAEEVEKILAEDDGLEDYDFGDDDWPADDTEIKYVQAGAEEEAEPDTEEEDETEEYMPDDYHPDDIPAQGPYSISRREFSNGKLYFDKADLEYYEEDDVLVDPYTDEVITDLRNSVGEGFRIEFSKEDPDMAYIRNENTGSDYSIRRIHARYYDEMEDED